MNIRINNEAIEEIYSAFQNNNQYLNIPIKISLLEKIRNIAKIIFTLGHSQRQATKKYREALQKEAYLVAEDALRKGASPSLDKTFFQNLLDTNFNATIVYCIQSRNVKKSLNFFLKGKLNESQTKRDESQTKRVLAIFIKVFSSDIKKIQPFLLLKSNKHILYALTCNPHTLRYTES